MPKFYIQDGVEQTVLHADSALQACFFAIKYRFEGIPVNGFYVASEKGFEKSGKKMMRRIDFSRYTCIMKAQNDVYGC